MKVEVVAEAGAEIEAAFDYLAQEASERTASELLDGIAEAQKAIIEHPNAWPPVKGGLRRYLLSRCPYQIVYRLEGDVIRIYAFAH